MKRTRKFALAVAAGAVTVGALVATPVLAAGPGGPGGCPWPQGQGQHSGRGHPDGYCMFFDRSIPKGTLTAEQKSTLAAAAEQEKMARDLYAAFADQYGLRFFDGIAAAEARHLTAVRTMLARYGASDPTEGKAAGEFASAPVRAAYDRLLAEGKNSAQAALTAGRRAEQARIDALRKALPGLTAPDVRQLYGNLLRAEHMHLTAFGRWTG
ncbi:DUF2202 domain-containing protein [Nonomuraea sp. NPDC048826]|uniref:DUF2202 domain-containing protein n=1 Tax=Nonomuraea sp. NPDC048826 TaxID=3364347 RepID=UPI003710FADB